MKQRSDSSPSLITALSYHFLVAISMAWLDFLSNFFHLFWISWPKWTKIHFIFLLSRPRNLLLLVDFSLSSDKIKVRWILRVREPVRAAAQSRRAPVMRHLSLSAAPFIFNEAQSLRVIAFHIPQSMYVTGNNASFVSNGNPVQPVPPTEPCIFEEAGEILWKSAD